jgi:hypothetical protein
MKLLKTLLIIFAGGALLGGGFFAGSAISRANAASAIPAGDVFIPPQNESNNTGFNGTPTPYPNQGNYGPGWMVQPNHTTPGRSGWGMHGRWMSQPNNGNSDANNDNWYPGWMMDQGYTPQGNKNWQGVHGGMMHGWQGNQNGNTLPQSQTPWPTSTAPVSFETDVQPIFIEQCSSCHGEIASLSLESYDEVMLGGQSGAVIIPGDVENSMLAYYLYTGYMPYGSSTLDAEQVQIIFNWIAAGALDN